jgi:hypothetical protein
MELRTGSLADFADQWESAENAAPAWWAYAHEFPRWYVWRGVTGSYYARIPGISPQRVLRASTPELLRDEILFSGASYRSVALSRFRKLSGNAHSPSGNVSLHCDLNR